MAIKRMPPKQRQYTESVQAPPVRKRKQVTEGVAKDPLVKRNTLIPRTKATAMPHVTPEFRQQVKERLASVSLDAPSTRENFMRIVAERERQLGTDRTANIMSEWGRLQTEPVIGDPAEEKRRQRVRELQRMYRSLWRRTKSQSPAHFFRRRPLGSPLSRPFADFRCFCKI